MNGGGKAKPSKRYQCQLPASSLTSNMLQMLTGANCGVKAELPQCEKNGAGPEFFVYAALARPDCNRSYTVESE